VNQISWLIYIANQLDVLRTILNGYLVVGGFSILMMGIGFFVISADGGEPAPVGKWMKRLCVIGIVCLILVLFVPSKSTIMMIAVSQVGEQILSTDKAQQAGGEVGGIAEDSLKVLRQYLDQQLAKPAAPK
jgi:hypothetical protein